MSQVHHHHQAHSHTNLRLFTGNAHPGLARSIAAHLDVNVGDMTSTRFNDGGELGLGAEIGISTSRLHAFGPMGLRELTSQKYVILGQGQVR